MNVPRGCLVGVVLVACTGGDDDTDGSCLTDDDLGVLGAYVSVIAADLTFLAGHGSANEALGFFELPSMTVAGPSWFTLFMPCDEAVLFDPYCDGSVCWQLECTEPGPAWVQHGSLDSPPVSNGGWTYDDAVTDVSWDQATGIVGASVDAQVLAPDDTDYSLTGSASVDGPDATLIQVYPNLLSAEATLEAAFQVSGSGSHDGQITMDGEVIAVMVAGGAAFAFEGAGACASR